MDELKKERIKQLTERLSHGMWNVLVNFVVTPFTLLAINNLLFSTSITYIQAFLMVITTKAVFNLLNGKYNQ